MHPPFAENRKNISCVVNRCRARWPKVCAVCVTTMHHHHIVPSLYAPCVCMHTSIFFPFILFFCFQNNIITPNSVYCTLKVKSIAANTMHCIRTLHCVVILRDGLCVLKSCLCAHVFCDFNMFFGKRVTAIEHTIKLRLWTF